MQLHVPNMDSDKTNAQNDEQHHDDVDDQQVEDEVEILIDNAQMEYDILHDDDLGGDTH